jgi:hypothetical protein
MRRITRGSHCLGRFLGTLHEGQDQVGRSNIQKAFDQHRIVPGRAHHRGGGGVGVDLHGLQLLQHHRQFIGRMLGVDHHPVKARRSNDLGHDVAAQHAPQTDLRPSFLERALERVHWQFHLMSPVGSVDFGFRRGGTGMQEVEVAAAFSLRDVL